MLDWLAKNVEGGVRNEKVISFERFSRIIDGYVFYGFWGAADGSC
jgi:hypothetical protein